MMAWPGVHVGPSPSGRDRGACVPRTTIALRPATPADHEFCFQLHKAAMGDYITDIWGWDETRSATTTLARSIRCAGRSSQPTGSMSGCRSCTTARMRSTSTVSRSTPTTRDGALGGTSSGDSSPTPISAACHWSLRSSPSIGASTTSTGATACVTPARTRPTRSGCALADPTPQQQRQTCRKDPRRMLMWSGQRAPRPDTARTRARRTEHRGATRR